MKKYLAIPAALLAASIMGILAPPASSLPPDPGPTTPNNSDLCVSRYLAMHPSPQAGFSFRCSRPVTWFAILLPPRQYGKLDPVSGLPIGPQFDSVLLFKRVKVNGFKCHLQYVIWNGKKFKNDAVFCKGHARAFQWVNGKNVIYVPHHPTAEPCDDYYVDSSVANFSDSNQWDCNTTGRW